MGDTVLAAMQKSSQGLISNTDMMKSFNLASLVNEQFALQLPQAFEYLGKVSAATGTDMNYLLDSLVRGVGRLSPLILDNLGIQVSLTEAYEAYGRNRQVHRATIESRTTDGCIHCGDGEAERKRCCNER